MSPTGWFHSISHAIRENPVAVIRKVFDTHLLELLTEAKGANAQDSLNYGLFKETGIELEKRSWALLLRP